MRDSFKQTKRLFFPICIAAILSAAACTRPKNNEVQGTCPILTIAEIQPLLLIPISKIENFSQLAKSDGAILITCNFYGDLGQGTKNLFTITYRKNGSVSSASNSFKDAKKIWEEKEKGQLSDISSLGDEALWLNNRNMLVTRDGANAIILHTQVKGLPDLKKRLSQITNAIIKQSKG